MFILFIMKTPKYFFSMYSFHYMSMCWPFKPYAVFILLVILNFCTFYSFYWFSDIEYKGSKLLPWLFVPNQNMKKFYIIHIQS